MLAAALAKRSNGPVDGFVVERPSAGGHNAPPRGAFGVDDAGQPAVRGARRRRLRRAHRSRSALLDRRRHHVSRPTSTRPSPSARVASRSARSSPTATSREWTSNLRRRVLDEVKNASVTVTTSLRASSTGYPFKVASSGRHYLRLRAPTTDAHESVTWATCARPSSRPTDRRVIAAPPNRSTPTSERGATSPRPKVRRASATD